MMHDVDRLVICFISHIVTTTAVVYALERARPAASMTPPCLIYLSTSTSISSNNSITAAVVALAFVALACAVDIAIRVHECKSTPLHEYEQRRSAGAARNVRLLTFEL